MGFSVAAAAAIIFAGGLVCFSVVMQAMTHANDDLRDARIAEAARAQERSDSKISAINGTANGTVVDANFTNAGSATIHVNSLDVLVNGTLYTLNVTTKTVDGVSATNLWAPGQTLHLVLSAPVSGPANIRLVTDAGYAFTGTVS